MRVSKLDLAMGDDSAYDCGRIGVKRGEAHGPKIRNHTCGLGYA